MDNELSYLGGGGQYFGGTTAAESLVSKKAATVKERIEIAVKQAEARLIAAKRAKELFDKNPDLEELLNIMQNGYF